MKKLISILSLFSISSCSLSSTISCNVQPKSTFIDVNVTDDGSTPDSKKVDKYRTAETPLPILARDIFEVLTFTTDKYTNKDKYEQDFKNIVGEEVLKNFTFESINNQISKYNIDTDEWKEFYNEFYSSDNVDNSFTSLTFDFTNNNTDYSTNEGSKGLPFYIVNDDKKDDHFDINKCEKPITYDKIDDLNSNSKLKEVVSSFKDINIIGKPSLSAQKLTSVDSDTVKSKNMPLDVSEGEQIKILTKKGSLDDKALYYRSTSLKFSINFHSLHLNKTYTINFESNNLLELFSANIVGRYLIFTPYMYSFKNITSDFKDNKSLFENFNISKISFTKNN